MAESLGTGRSKKLLVELDDVLRQSLEAFCEAHYDAPQVSIVREALKTFIETQLEAEPVMRKRYEAAMAQRRTGIRDKLRVVDLNAKGE
ncbi:MAG: hypothetical protein ACREJ5_12520 [Geminicoccaceae bacterium]